VVHEVFVTSFRAAYIFYFFALIETYMWRSVFPWLRFFRPSSLFTFYSLQPHVHTALQERLWWMKGSCSGVSIISRVAN